MVTNHNEVVAGRIKYLLTAIRAAEANGVDWPKGLLNEMRKWGDNQISATRVVALEVLRAAEEMQK